MMAPFIYGHITTPAGIADEKGNKVICMNVQNNTSKGVEDLLRSASMMYGLFVGLAFAPFSKSDVANHFVPYSISRCWRLGRAILMARKNKTSPIKSIEEQENGKLIFKGKVVDLHRRIERGYNFGSIKIEGFDEHKDVKMTIEFQNENLIAYIEKPGQEGKEMVASVPDLICIVGNERYECILTEDLRYGLRIAVLLIPSVPMMATEQALKAVHPRCFGYEDVEYNPMGGFKEHKSEIHESSL
jgi:DUF917 family protein